MISSLDAPRATPGRTRPSARTSRRAPTSLQAVCAYRSPTVSSGVRTFARMISSSSAFGSPRAEELHDRHAQALLVDLARLAGEHAAADVGRVAAVREVARPARPPRKTGVTTVMSLIWPLVIHGSFVTSTSPGSSGSGGKAATKCRSPVAIALMCPGVPVSDCATIQPRASNTPQARSSDSRTIVRERRAHERRLLLVDDREQPVPDQPRPRIGSIERSSSAASTRQLLESRSDASRAAGRAADDDGRLALLDDRRAVEPVPAPQRRSGRRPASREAARGRRVAARSPRLRLAASRASGGVEAQVAAAGRSRRRAS